MTRVIAQMTHEDPRAAIALYEKALGARTATILDGPGGSVMDAEIEIGETTLMVSGVWEGMTTAPDGTSPVNFALAVDDADAAYAHALAHGMTSVMAPQDMFYGQRSGSVRDPYGYRWTFMHTIEEVSPDELSRRAAEFAKTMAD